LVAIVRGELRTLFSYDDGAGDEEAVAGETEEEKKKEQ